MTIYYTETFRLFSENWGDIRRKLPVSSALPTAPTPTIRRDLVPSESNRLICLMFELDYLPKWIAEIRIMSEVKIGKTTQKS